MSRRTLTRAPNPHAAPPVAIATRRDLFGAMGAMLLLTSAEAGPAKAAELDGELLECCAEMLAIDRESDRLWAVCLALPDDAMHHPAFDAHDAHWDGHGDRYWDLARRLRHMPARTPEGLRQKAAAALSAMPADDRGAGGNLVVSLLDDVMGRAGA